MGHDLLKLEDFQGARRRIGERVHRTPIVSCARLGERVGAQLRLKAELFQKTGSFKIRGVLNKLLSLAEDERGRGLISISAGNHAAALAYGASVVGERATIVMPAGAVRSKVEATRGYGGEVIFTAANLLDTCHQIQRERRLVFVHPFDDLLIMAGHGTLGLEVVEELPELALLVVPVGGGGLISGVATAVKRSRPQVRVVGVEPTGADAMTRSLAQGRPAHLDRFETIADGLAAPFVGEHNFRHVKEFVDEVVAIPDAPIVEATRLVLTRSKLAAEPSAAASVAALLARAVEPPDRGTICCVISGGNVDREVLRQVV
jgi:threonine dehydratase